MGPWPSAKLCVLKWSRGMLTRYWEKGIPTGWQTSWIGNWAVCLAGALEARRVSRVFFCLGEHRSSIAGRDPVVPRTDNMSETEGLGPRGNSGITSKGHLNNMFDE